MNLKNTRAIAESGGRSRLCHCGERRDEAISIPGMGDCVGAPQTHLFAFGDPFAALAMTYGGGATEQLCVRPVIDTPSSCYRSFVRLCCSQRTDAKGTG